MVSVSLTIPVDGRITHPLGSTESPLGAGALAAALIAVGAPDNPATLAATTIRVNVVLKLEFISFRYFTVFARSAVRVWRQLWLLRRPISWQQRRMMSCPYSRVARPNSWVADIRTYCRTNRRARSGRGEMRRRSPHVFVDQTADAWRPFVEDRYASKHEATFRANSLPTGVNTISSSS